MTVFNEFYKTKEKKKKLTWIYSLGTCQINGKFEQRTNELIVSTPQAILVSVVFFIWGALFRKIYGFLSEIICCLPVFHRLPLLCCLTVQID